MDELDELIKYWSEALIYHLTNRARAIEAGAPNSAEQNQSDAAEAGSILTGLIALRSEMTK